MTSPPFVVRVSAHRVEGWVGAPLPFEPRAWMLEYRQALRAALGRLVPTIGRSLVGRYATADARRCDVENLLLYNIGVSAFAHLEVGEVVLTRSGRPPPPPEGASVGLVHHHRYEIAEAPAFPSGTVIARLAPTPLRRPLRVERVWYDIRSGGRLVADDRTVDDHLAVTLFVHRPPGPSPALLGMVKVLVDGFMSALHIHDGTKLDAVAERLGGRLGVAPVRVAGLLSANSAGVLGLRLRRLVWPFRDFVQWNPADDVVVRLQVSVRAAPTWQLTGTVATLRHEELPA